jgi:chromosome segregation ATPase
MKFTKTLILLVALFSSFTATVAADESNDPGDAAQTVDTLRLQLLEVQSKEADLEARVKQLDEDLKPENIERALAGVGSTRPEELRELRRRQLTIERDSLRGQLQILTRSRERLESVIRTAEAQAYQQTALEPSLNQISARNAGPGWRLGMLVGLIAVMVFVIMIGIARRAHLLSK